MRSLICDSLSSRYQRELSAAVERHADLERGKAQAELDWQHRCQDVERREYDKAESLIRGLTQARDQVITGPIGTSHSARKMST